MMYIPCSSPLGLLSFFLMSTLISVYLGRRNQNTANMCSVCYSLRTSCTGDNSEIRTNLDTSNSRIVQPIVTPILETDDDSELDKIDVGPFAVGEPEIKELNKRDEQCLLNRCYTCNKRTGFTGFRCRAASARESASRRTLPRVDAPRRADATSATSASPSSPPPPRIRRASSSHLSSSADGSLRLLCALPTAAEVVPYKKRAPVS